MQELEVRKPGFGPPELSRSFGFSCFRLAGMLTTEKK